VICENYVVYELVAERFKPFEKVFGPLTVEPITTTNVDNVVDSFYEGKIAVFREKLRNGQIGFSVAIKTVLSATCGAANTTAIRQLKSMDMCR
jgi:hypothetical protein